MSISARDLRPYGYAPGFNKVWCAACSRTGERMDAKAFKCKPCAVTQFKEVERLCFEAGMEDAK